MLVCLHTRQMRHRPQQRTRTHLVHQGDDLQNQLVLTQVVAVLEDNRVFASVFCLKEQLGGHKSALQRKDTASTLGED